MGGVTPGGLPYPLGSDKVVDGDNAIRALAEAIETAYGAAATPWVRVAMATGWLTPVPARPTAVRFSGKYDVAIQGLIQVAAGAGNLIGTVPVAYRPLHQVTVGGIATSSANKTKTIEIGTDGTLTMVENWGPIISANEYYAFSFVYPIDFDAPAAG